MLILAEKMRKNEKKKNNATLNSVEVWFELGNLYTLYQGIYKSTTHLFMVLISSDKSTVIAFYK